MLKAPTGSAASSHELRINAATGAVLLAGFLLRVFFLRRHAFLAGDSLLYQDIALNWLHDHVYGLSTDAAPRPTLIRLPGYPAILAACAWAFDRVLQAEPATLRSFLPALWLQVVADLLTCWVSAKIAVRMLGHRAGVAALALGCLCPFTANYVAVPLTETFTLFFLALAFLLLQRWLLRPSGLLAAGVAGALACSILLRPDQGLLLVIVLPMFLLAHSDRIVTKQRILSAGLCMALTAMPLLPWTLRNLRTFHVFQPLASRLANDPGETPPLGFQHWFRTWAIDFSSTEDAYWKYPEDTVLLADLPDRAFDSAKERDKAAALLLRAAETHRLDPSVEAGFDSLASTRARAHPWRTYVLLPVARVLNMLLHPRVEMLPVAERWWQYRLYPRETAFAWSYAALNLLYFAAAAAGFLRVLHMRDGKRALPLAMAGYILLRCALLLTLDNAEQRYTLEFFPLLFVFASALWLNHNRAEA